MGAHLSNYFLGNVLAPLFGEPTLLCIAGSRIFFNLKEAAEHGVNIGTNWSSYSRSAIRFGEPEQELRFVSRALSLEDSESDGPLLSTLQSRDLQSGDVEYV